MRGFVLHLRERFWLPSTSSCAFNLVLCFVSVVYRCFCFYFFITCLKKLVRLCISDDAVFQPIICKIKISFHLPHVTFPATSIAYTSSVPVLTGSLHCSGLWLKVGRGRVGTRDRERVGTRYRGFGKVSLGTRGREIGDVGTWKRGRMGMRSEN